MSLRLLQRIFARSLRFARNLLTSSAHRYICSAFYFITGFIGFTRSKALDLRTTGRRFTKNQPGRRRLRSQAAHQLGLQPLSEPRINNQRKRPRCEGLNIPRRRTMRTRAFSTILALVFMLAATLPALPQADVSSATIKGTVSDQNNALVAGATVTAQDNDRGITRVAKTNAEGAYQIPALPPGSYEVRVEATGFGAAVLSKVELTVGLVAIRDVQLRVGTVTTEVVVTGDAPLIQIEQSQQANTINQAQVENLPNINRTMTSAVFTLPGVTNAEATRSQQPGFTGFATTGFSIGGSNGRNNLSTIDGGENEYGSGQYRVFIPVDSIQEFQVNRSSFAAEFGFTVGSSVNIVTKSGTNQLHGNAYGYFRNSTTQANNFIDQLRNGRELYAQNMISGGTLGGPIKKNKLFFFVSYEYVKTDFGGFNFLLNSPSALGVNGNTPAGIAQTNYLNQLAASGSPTLIAVAQQLRQSLVPQSDPKLLALLKRDDGAFDNLTKTHTLVR